MLIAFSLACSLLIALAVFAACGLLEQLTATSEDAHQIAHDTRETVREIKVFAVEVVLPAAAVLIAALVESVRRGRKWKRRYRDGDKKQGGNDEAAVDGSGSGDSDDGVRSHEDVDQGDGG